MTTRDSGLWTPTPTAPTVTPTERKKDGGSYFDDELETNRDYYETLMEEGERLVNHLRERPDHVVHVGSARERDELRQVFNLWFQAGALNHHPTIHIDYGVAEGAIRIGDGR